MQIVRDHQHGAAQLFTQLIDEIVQRQLAVDVHPLRGFVQHQQLRFVQQRSRQQHALVFSPESFCIGWSSR